MSRDNKVKRNEVKHRIDQYFNKTVTTLSHDANLSHLFDLGPSHTEEFDVRGYMKLNKNIIKSRLEGKPNASFMSATKRITYKSDVPGPGMEKFLLNMYNA